MITTIPVGLLGLGTTPAPPAILSSGVAGINSTPDSNPITDSITVPSGTTALVFAACVNSAAAATFTSVQFNSVAMTEKIAMNAAATAASPGWNVWVMHSPSIGTHNLTANRSAGMSRSARLWIALSGDIHTDVFGPTNAPTPSTANVDPRSVALTTIYADSLCLAGSCSQGSDTDPMTGADDVDAILQTGDTGGTSTTADVGYAVGWGATPTTGAKTFTFDAAASDGGQAWAAEVRPE